MFTNMHFIHLNLKNIEAIVGLQCDHPDRNIPVDDTINDFRNNKLDTLYSEDKKGKRNGAHFIIARNFVRRKNN